MDKEDYRAMLQLDDNIDINYDWDEFLPSLGFNNSFSYIPPDIDTIIDNQIRNIAQLSKLDKVADKIKISEITSSIQDNNLNLKKVEGFLSYDLMTKINNIITTRNIPDNPDFFIYTRSRPGRHILLRQRPEEAVFVTHFCLYTSVQPHIKLNSSARFPLSCSQN